MEKGKYYKNKDNTSYVKVLRIYDILVKCLIVTPQKKTDVLHKDDGEIRVGLLYNPSVDNWDIISEKEFSEAAKRTFKDLLNLED